LEELDKGFSDISIMMRVTDEHLSQGGPSFLRVRSTGRLDMIPAKVGNLIFPRREAINQAALGEASQDPLPLCPIARSRVTAERHGKIDHWIDLHLGSVRRAVGLARFVLNPLEHRALLCIQWWLCEPSTLDVSHLLERDFVQPFPEEICPTGFRANQESLVVRGPRKGLISADSLALDAKLSTDPARDSKIRRRIVFELDTGLIVAAERTRRHISIRFRIKKTLGTSSADD